MRRYILRRLLHLVPTLLGISVLVFFIIQAAPGNPLRGLVDPTMSAADMARRTEQLGINDPWYIQYFTWLRETAGGNLGYSIRYKRPVVELIRARIWPTFLLTFSSLFLSFVIAVPLGILSATRRHSRLDYLSSLLAITGMSIPVFFFGMVMIKLFAFDIRLFPVGGMMTAGLRHASLTEYVLDVARHMALPLTVLTLVGTASFTRYTRSCMLEVLNQDYVRTARAKGLSERVVIYKHALRNALIPVITILGLSLPALFSGAILVETVFVWPGMGLLNVEAISARDYPLVMGITLFLAVLALLGNLLADIFYSVVDPRIRYD